MLYRPSGPQLDVIASCSKTTLNVSTETHSLAMTLIDNVIRPLVVGRQERITSCHTVTLPILHGIVSANMLARIVGRTHADERNHYEIIALDLTLNLEKPNSLDREYGHSAPESKER